MAQNPWATSQWTWLSGNSTVPANGTYGIKGLPSIDNYPGSRYGASTALDSASNCIYVFGGSTISAAIVSGYLNDLWMYNINTAQWTWLSGNTTAVYGVYGTKGVPSTNNYPGSRTGHSMVFDASLNCLYMYGGIGFAQGISGPSGALIFMISSASFSVGIIRASERFVDVQHQQHRMDMAFGKHHNQYLWRIRPGLQKLSRQSIELSRRLRSSEEVHICLWGCRI